jgi:Domain of unknown function (DUF4375)
MAAVDWQALSSLEAGELQTQLLDHANEEMKGLDADQEAETLPTLPDPMRIIWVLSSLSIEVMMGSFLAYFMNSAGRHSTAAITALSEIGATRMAAVLKRAARSVELNRDAWSSRKIEIDEAAEAYDVLTPYEDLPNADELSDLTDEFREAEDQDNWGDLLDSYLKRSVERLAKTESS